MLHLEKLDTTAHEELLEKQVSSESHDYYKVVLTKSFFILSQ